jgi:hypothetical protein
MEGGEKFLLNAINILSFNEYFIENFIALNYQKHYGSGIDWDYLRDLNQPDFYLVEIPQK